MPIDGIMMGAIRDELTDVCLDAKVEKIFQPEKDAIVFQLYCPNGGSFGKNQKMILSANPSCPKIYLTGKSQENPIVAPNFCMLLRKHLSGAKIIAFRQPPFERVLEIVFETRTELYETVNRKIIIEIMGRSSNIIFTDGEDKIIDTIRQVDLTTSSKRIILPGSTYVLPPSQNKSILSEETVRGLDYEGEQKLSQLLLNTFQGFSPLISREITYRRTLDTETRCDRLNEQSKIDVRESLMSLMGDISEKRYSPCVLEKEKPTELYCFDIQQYGGELDKKHFESVSEAIEYYFSQSDAVEHKKRLKTDISKLLSNVRTRIVKKINIQQKELDETENSEKYRLYGDLIYANQNMIKTGMANAKVIDYYSEDMKEISIPLNTTLSPRGNAQRYYKLYKKAQNAKIMLSKELPESKKELEYIDSVINSLSMADNSSDIEQIKNELKQEGYLNSSKKLASKKIPASTPETYYSSEGAKILVGKNNLQNDNLTLKVAGKNDIWFHVKNYPGSHTILFTENGKYTDRSVEEAAIIAASHCGIDGEGRKVEVDYTEVRNVKKPNGARPGMVIYDDYRTAFVYPDHRLCEKLKKK